MKSLDKVANYWDTALDDNFNLLPGEEVYFPKLLNIAARSSSILEVGVGKGRMVSILRKNGVNSKFYGLDITDNVKNSGTAGVIGDARVLPFPDNTFDLVYSLGAVEHFPETYLAVIEHARVVKEGGYVIITVPHFSFFTPLQYLVYLIIHSKKGTFEEIMGRNIRLNTMKKYFLKSNLTIIGYYIYGMYLIHRILKKFKLQIIQDKFQQNIGVGAYLCIIGIKKNIEVSK